MSKKQLTVKEAYDNFIVSHGQDFAKKFIEYANIHTQLEKNPQEDQLTLAKLVEFFPPKILQQLVETAGGFKQGKTIIYSKKVSISAVLNMYANDDFEDSTTELVERNVGNGESDEGLIQAIISGDTGDSPQMEDEVNLFWNEVDSFSDTITELGEKYIPSNYFMDKNIILSLLDSKIEEYMKANPKPSQPS